MCEMNVTQQTNATHPICVEICGEPFEFTIDDADNLARLLIEAASLARQAALVPWYERMRADHPTRWCNDGWKSALPELSQYKSGSECWQKSNAGILLWWALKGDRAATQKADQIWHALQPISNENCDDSTVNDKTTAMAKLIRLMIPEPTYLANYHDPA